MYSTGFIFKTDATEDYARLKADNKRQNWGNRLNHGADSEDEGEYCFIKVKWLRLDCFLRSSSSFNVQRSTFSHGPLSLTIHNLHITILGNYSTTSPQAIFTFRPQQILVSFNRSLLMSRLLSSVGGVLPACYIVRGLILLNSSDSFASVDIPAFVSRATIHSMQCFGLPLLIAVFDKLALWVSRWRGVQRFLVTEIWTEGDRTMCNLRSLYRL